MKNVFLKKDNSKRVIITLHGTGGDENDILPIGERIDEEASILSIRGNINENGMNRFFKRFGIGSYDLVNYVEEVNNLKEAITKYSNEYNFDLDLVTVVGFSNGANIALGLLQEYPKFINNYVLLSPDYINKDKGFLDSKNLNIYISTAKNDPYVNNDNMDKMISLLESSNANVTTYYGNGHQITYQVLEDIDTWYQILKNNNI